MSKKNPFLPKKPFEMPRQLLNALSECSPGGYILFYLDENNTCCVTANFSEDVYERGVRSFATSFLEGVNNSESIIQTENMLQQEEGGEEFPSEDDENFD